MFDSISSLRARYDEALDRQAHTRELTRTPFDRKVSDALYETLVTALEDGQKGHALFRVFHAPTGSGKSSAAYSAIAALIESDPTSSVAFLCDTMAQLDEAYREIVKLIDPSLVAIWSTAHNAKLDPADVYGDHGFRPAASFPREALRTHRVALATHRLYQGPHADIVFMFRDVPRSLIIIDERIKEVETFDVASADILAARELIAAEPPINEQSAVQMLSGLHDHLERLWQQDGKPPFSPVPSDFSLVWFGEDKTQEWCRQHAQKYGEKLSNVFGFARALMQGCAFMARHIEGAQGGRFIGYSMNLPIRPGTILLDATANIDGVSQLVDWRKHSEVPALRYDRLKIKHIAAPTNVVEDGERVTQVLRSPKKAAGYGRWIVKAVLENTVQGEEVLVVVHKTLLDNEYGLPKGASYTDEPCDIDGRRLWFLNWGAGVGSNRWRDCTTVFLFGEFHIPRWVTVASVLGLKSVEATSDTLRPFQSPATKHPDFLYLRDGHILRWIKQLAARGSLRKIDGEGVCGDQRLIVTGEFSRISLYLDRVFPGAELEQSEDAFGEDIQKGGATSLVTLLSGADEQELTFADVKKACGVDLTKNGKRYLCNAKVEAVMDRRNWTVVPGRGRGKPSRLVRSDK